MKTQHLNQSMDHDGHETVDSRHTTANGNYTPMRILILDNNSETLEKIANTLWIWPHSIKSAENVSAAIGSCRTFHPTIVITTIDFFLRDSGHRIRPLRERLPDTPIIALGAPSQYAELPVVLRSGADALLTQDDLDRPNLHSILARVHRTPRHDPSNQTPVSIQMPVPWRSSWLVGSLICDIDGKIIAANECLASWLEFPGVESLIGKSVQQDLMQCADDWKPWTDIAGDVAASLRQSITVKSRNNQLLCMQVEVFSAPESPTDLQAMLTH